MEVSTADAGKTSRSRLAYLLPCILALYLLAYLLAWLVAKDSALTWSLDLLNIVGPLIAAALCLVAARKSDKRRHLIFWSLLAAAMLCDLLAETIWAIYELGLGTDPFPSVGDLFWLLAYPLQFAAIVFLASSKGIGRFAAASVAAGALFVGVVAGTLLALFVMLPSIDSGAGTLSNVVTLLYPAGDVLLLSALGALALLPSDSARRMPRGILWIAGSFVVDVVADIVYSTKEINGTYETGSWVDLLWPLAYALTAAAAAWHLIRPKPRPRIM